MAKISRTLKTSKPLEVFRDVWASKTWYVDAQGKRKPLENYDAARQVASKAGFKGIHINYLA